MKLRKLLLSKIILFTVIHLSGQEIYTLQKCIDIGLENNFSLMHARNRESISNNNYTRGSAGYLPSVDLNSRAGGTLTNTYQNLTDGSENTSNGVHNSFASAGVTLGVTVFDGFSVRTTYKKLGELQQMGELNTRLSVENFIAGLVAEYNNYIQQSQLYKNLEYAVSLSKERVRIDEERYLLGSGSKLQLLQSQVYLNADSSRLARQYEMVRNIQIWINELMALEDLGAPVTITDTCISVIPDLDFERIYQATMASNTSLLIASKNRLISEYDQQLIASNTYPYLNFSGGYSYGLNYFGSGQVRNQTAGTMNYGLTLGMNLFDGYNQKRRIRNAQIETENKMLQYLEVEQGVKADLIAIYNGYTNNLRLLLLEEQNLETAAENLDIALERYKLGNLSGLELREVQKSLLDAEERLLSVQYQAKLAEISLLQISGRITEYLED